MDQLTNELRAMSREAARAAAAARRLVADEFGRYVHGQGRGPTVDQLELVARMTALEDSTREAYLKRLSDRANKARGTT